MSGYWQGQAVFGQGSRPGGAFLCSESGLSTGILGRLGCLTCTELAGTHTYALGSAQIRSFGYMASRELKGVPKASKLVRIP